MKRPASMTLKRFPDWPGRLDLFLVERREVPFKWGKQDCGLFACDAVLAMTGTDLAETFRGKYTSAMSLRAVFREMGIDEATISGIADWLAELWQIREVPPRFAQRGDVVLLEEHTTARECLSGRQSLGVVSLDGNEIWAPGEFGLVRVPLAHAVRAWRI